jgi:acyl-CoA dehydrogenase
MFLDFSMAVAFQKIQDAFDGIFANMDVFGVYWFFKGPLRWWSRLNFVGLAPTDRLTHRVANALLTNEGQRDRLTKGIYMPTKVGESLVRLESAYKVIRQAEAVDAKIRKAVKARKLNKKSKTLLGDALQAGVITAQEQALLAEAEKQRWDAIQVDEYSQDEYLHFGTNPPARPTTTVDKPMGKGAIHRV